MAQPAAPPPPEDLEEQAARTRTAAELAAVALFVAAASEDEPSPADVAVVRRILHGLVKGIALGALESSGPPRGSEVEIRSIAEGLADRLSRIDSPEVRDLIKTIRKIRQSNRDAPPRGPGELSLAREAARNFATWAYGRAIEAVAPAIEEVRPGWVASSLALKKTWVSQGDSRVRPLHRRLHARTRSWNQDFWRWPVTGQRLRFPGDPEAPLDAVIGCRCLCWLSWSKGDDLTKAIKELPPLERLP